MLRNKIETIAQNPLFNKISKEILEIYIINYKIKNRILTIDEGIKFLDNIRINFDKFSKNSIIYIFVEMFNYFEALNEWSYFLRARSNVNHILKVRLINNSGSKIYYNKFSQLYNNYCSKEDIKVAIMIAGAFRGHYEHCLEATVNLAKNLNADIFIASWNKVFCYPGLGGAGGNYVDRNFASIKNICPDFINNKSKLRNHFPNVFKILNKEFNEPLSKNTFLKFGNITGVELADDDVFQRTIVDKYINQIQNVTQEQLLNHLDVYFANVCRQFYLLDKCSTMIVDYEKRNHFKYDYIIKIRPDYIPSQLQRCELLRLKPNEIAANWMGQVELNDNVLYGGRDEVLQFMNIYNFNKKQNFRYFLNMFSVGGIHGMLSNWIMLNNLSPVSMRLHASCESKFHISYLPNFDKELEEDIKNSKLNEEQLKACILFFDKLKNLIQQNNIEIMNKKVESAKQKNIIKDTAKSRIQSQLTYKIGRAMIENSKSIWGYIRMPYVLSYIKEQHQKEQKAYNDKIKADPSLKLPPIELYPDYQDALKEKECLTYKLGTALIEADKSPLKLGYLSLWFKCKAIQKSHKK